MPMFNVDESSSDDEYFYVDIPSRFATVVIKIEDEGIVTDIWPLSCVNEPVATAYAFTADLCQSTEVEGSRMQGEG